MQKRKSVVIIALLFSFLAFTCADTGKKNLKLTGKFKIVIIRDNYGYSTYEIFFTEGKNIYNIAFAEECAVEGGSESMRDGDGFPVLINKKTWFTVHSNATYELEAKHNEKGVLLSTRKTMPLLVTKISCVEEGEGASYCDQGWEGKKTTWAPPEALGTEGIFVNDSGIRVRVENGKLYIESTKIIDINSLAEWAKETN